MSCRRDRWTLGGQETDTLCFGNDPGFVNLGCIVSKTKQIDLKRVPNWKIYKWLAFFPRVPSWLVCRISYFLLLSGLLHLELLLLSSKWETRWEFKTSLSVRAAPISESQTLHEAQRTRVIESLESPFALELLLVWQPHGTNTSTSGKSCIGS